MKLFAETVKESLFGLIHKRLSPAGRGRFRPSVDEAIDYDAHMILTRKQTNAVKALMKENPGLYRHITTGKVFDYLDLHENLFYELRFRIVRFLLSDGTYETVITNLDKESFPADILKELYFRRWGIETSFRQLKYTVALKHFQSKKVEFIDLNSF